MAVLGSVQVNARYTTRIMQDGGDWDHAQFRILAGRVAGKSGNSLAWSRSFQTRTMEEKDLETVSNLLSSLLLVFMSLKPETKVNPLLSLLPVLMGSRPETMEATASETDEPTDLYSSLLPLLLSSKPVGLRSFFSVHLLKILHLRNVASGVAVWKHTSLY